MTYKRWSIIFVWKLFAFVVLTTLVVTRIGKNEQSQPAGCFKSRFKREATNNDDTTDLPTVTKVSQFAENVDSPNNSDN